MLQKTKMKKYQVLSFLFFIFFTVNADASCEVQFEWSPNPESYVIGYKIYYGANKGGPYDHEFNAGKPTEINGKITVTIPDIPDGTWYFVATAYDEDYESQYSTEVSFICNQTAENGAPSITMFSAAPNPAENPYQKIDFAIQASDPDGDALTYTIDFGDSSSSTSGSSAIHAYTANGTYTATATVSDNHGHSVSKSIQVTVNDAKPAKVKSVKVQ